MGGDFPKEFRATLRKEGIDLRGLRTVRAVPSSTCFIVEDGRGGQLTLIDQGPLRAARPSPFAVGPTRAAAFAHLTTGPPEALVRLAGSLAGGPRLAVDPAQEIHYRWTARLLTALLAHAEILFGNRVELAAAARLLGHAGPRGLLDRVPLVVGTLGPAGAVAYARTGTVRVPGRRPTRVHQVTGAGDAFRGGFYAGWIRGRPLRACLASGVDSATHWIGGGGSLGRSRAGTT